MRNKLFILLLTVLVVNFSTGQEKPAAEKPATIEKLKVADYTFTFSKPWVNQPAGGMRSGVLRFTQTDEKLEDVDAVFFHFGGTVEQNLERWKGQFVGDAKTSVEKKEINGKKVSYFTGSGAFMNSMGGGPFAPKTKQEGMAVLAAILPSEEEGKLVFLKMTGKQESVEAAKKSFFELVETALK